MAAGSPRKRTVLDRLWARRSAGNEPDPVLWLIDFTGIGRPVFDMFGQHAALRHAQSAVIAGGRETSATRTGWSVPKGELVRKLQALLHAGDLRIAAACRIPPCWRVSYRTSACDSPTTTEGKKARLSHRVAPKPRSGGVFLGHLSFSGLNPSTSNSHTGAPS